MARLHINLPGPFSVSTNLTPKSGGGPSRPRQATRSELRDDGIHSAMLLLRSPSYLAEKGLTQTEVSSVGVGKLAEQIWRETVKHTSSTRDGFVRANSIIRDQVRHYEYLDGEPERRAKREAKERKKKARERRKAEKSAALQERAQATLARQTAEREQEEKVKREKAEARQARQMERAAEVRESTRQRETVKAAAKARGATQGTPVTEVVSTSESPPLAPSDTRSQTSASGGESHEPYRGYLAVSTLDGQYLRIYLDGRLQRALMAGASHSNIEVPLASIQHVQAKLPTAMTNGSLRIIGANETLIHQLHFRKKHVQDMLDLISALTSRGVKVRGLGASRSERL